MDKIYLGSQIYKQSYLLLINFITEILFQPKLYIKTAGHEKIMLLNCY